MMTSFLETHPSLIAGNPTTMLHQTSLVFINAFHLVEIPLNESQYQRSPAVWTCCFGHNYVLKNSWGFPDVQDTCWLSSTTQSSLELQYQSNLSSVVMVCAYFEFLLVSGRLIDRRLSSKSLDHHHRRMLDFSQERQRMRCSSNQSHYQIKVRLCRICQICKIFKICKINIRNAKYAYYEM